MSSNSRTPTAFDKINLVRAFNDGEMSGVEKSILAVISTHLGDNNFVFLSISTLIHETCYTRQTIIQNINKLIKRGYITKISPSEGYKSNRYSINLELIASLGGRPVYQLDHPSLAARLPQSSSHTGAVYLLDPNRKINASLKEKENARAKNERQKPSFSSFKSEKQSKSQREIDAETIVYPTERVPQGYFYDDRTGKVVKKQPPPKGLMEEVRKKLRGTTILTNGKGNGNLK